MHFLYFKFKTKTLKIAEKLILINLKITKGHIALPGNCILPCKTTNPIYDPKACYTENVNKLKSIALLHINFTHFLVLQRPSFKEFSSRYSLVILQTIKLALTQPKLIGSLCEHYLRNEIHEGMNGDASCRYAVESV